MWRSILVSSLVLVGCQSRPVPPPSATGGNVVGVVGQIQITDVEFLKRLQLIESQFPRKFETHPQKFSALSEMMNVELLFQEALAQGLDKSFEFKTRLADVYVRKLSEDARAQITDSVIEAAYKKEKESFDQISVKHILLKWPNNASSADKKAIRAELESIREEVLKNPDSFPDVALKKSQDGSAPSGGELGFFSYSMMVKPFSEAAFKLKNIGEISPIVESPYGFHIIQLTGDRRDLKYARDQIQDHLLKVTQSERVSAEISRLKKQVQFQIFEEPLLKLSPLPKIVHDNPEKSVNFKTEGK